MIYLKKTDNCKQMVRKKVFIFLVFGRKSAIMVIDGSIAQPG